MMIRGDEVYVFKSVMVYGVNPTICIVGVLVNIFNLRKITRASVKSSASSYLLALAYADLLYLSASLAELFNYYRFTHFYLPAYFHLYSRIVWLKEAFSCISIGIIVCLTVERFGAVFFTNAKQQFFTERNSKHFIIALFLFCMVGTTSKSFEFGFSHKLKPYNAETDDYCDDVWACKNEVLNPLSARWKGLELCAQVDTSDLGNCTLIDYHNVEATNLHLNQQYRRIYTAVISVLFALIPALVLFAFNSILIVKIRQQLSNDKVKKMILKEMENSKASNIVSLTNHITILLIAGILLFLICKLPWTVYAMMLQFTAVLVDSAIQYAVAIILNTLVDLNAVINFILYNNISIKIDQLKDLIKQGYWEQQHHEISSPLLIDY